MVETDNCGTAPPDQAGRWRQTGRTTHMLRQARKALLAGETVVVLASTERYASHMTEQIQSWPLGGRLSKNVLSRFHPRSVMNAAALRDMRCVLEYAVYVDHCAWSFEPERALPANCLGAFNYRAGWGIAGQP